MRREEQLPAARTSALPGGPRRRVLWAAAALFLLLSSPVAACGGGEPPVPTVPVPVRSPTATPLPSPTATPVPAVPPTATPAVEPEPVVTREDLAGMVLTLEAVQENFPELQLDLERSGYRDNAAAARSTLDPEDTAANLASQGRIDGYDHEFTNPRAFFETDPMVTKPHIVLSVVDLYESNEEAIASVGRSMVELVRFEGQDIDGVMITDVYHADLPDIGESGVIGRMNQLLVQYEVESTGAFVMWVRGPVVARVLLVTVGLGDLGPVAEALARRMDRRIDGVLAGEISATPVVSDPALGSAGRAADRAALVEGYDLPAMLLRPEDLADDAAIGGEGFVPVGGGLPVYQRQISLRGPLKEAASTVSDVSQTVSLFPTVEEAQGPIRVLQTISHDAFKELVGATFLPSFGEQGGDAMTVHRPELPDLGDTAVVFEVSLDALVPRVDFVMLFFSIGRVSAQLIVAGPYEGIAPDDVIEMGRIIAQRVLQHSPTSG